MYSPSSGLALWRLLVLHWFGYALLIAGALPGNSCGSLLVAIFAAGAIASQAAIVAAVPTVGTAALLILSRQLSHWQLPLGFRRLSFVALAGLLYASMTLAIWLDLRVYAIFGFHFNGFLWNLIATPGGLTATGAGEATYRSLTLHTGLIVAEELVLVCSCRLLPQSRGFAPRRAIRALIAVAITLVLSEKAIYLWADLQGEAHVLRVAASIPAYQGVTAKRWATRLGVRVDGTTTPTISVDAASLRYPLQPLRVAPDARDYNILWICSESLRADALAPDSMPRTWRLAQKSQWFVNHLSGGNGTRVGVFSMLYGLPGTYWFDFLRERRGPVLIEHLLRRHYEVHALTSDDFSYPEFAQTAFRDLSGDQLWEGNLERDAEGRNQPSWVRDRRNVGEIRAFLASRNPNRPFFVYVFLESPHAPYENPPNFGLFRPFPRTVDYLQIDPARDAPGLHNRYRNSVLHLDSQIEELLWLLDERKLSNSTIVVVTGDHGEEFMEAGRWGHGSAFSEAQIRVPLVIRVPSRPPSRVEQMTSHLDLVPTLLHLLGVQNDPTDYSAGDDLLLGPGRSYSLVSDWNTVGLITSEGKLRMPWRARGSFRSEARSRADEFLEPGAVDRLRSGPIFARAVSDLSRFYARR